MVKDSEDSDEQVCNEIEGILAGIFELLELGSKLLLFIIHILVYCWLSYHRIVTELYTVCYHC